MKSLYTWLCLLFTTFTHAQPTAFKWREEVRNKYIGVNISASRYCGDLSERYNFAHLQLGWSIEAHMRYRLHERWTVGGDVGVYHVYADQRYTQNADNYLNFAATNFSANSKVQWDMLSVGENLRNVLYLFTGLGATALAPLTELNGTTYSLPAFKTEGKSYALWVAQFSYGMGFPMALGASTQLNIEGRYTHVLSDHLDDVSTYYVDKLTVSVVERSLADKRVAEGLPQNPSGAMRGNATKNDGYFLFTLQIIHKFR